MREVLFRGKRKDNGEWVYGWLIIGYDHRYYIVSYTDVNCLRGRNKPYATWRSIEVIPETVGEFTGLTDKNGKKIFEGDIVNCCSFAGINDFEKCLVGWSDLFLCFRTDTHSLYGDSGREYEVIGNIHDNPELLKGGAE